MREHAPKGTKAPARTRRRCAHSREKGKRVPPALPPLPPAAGPRRRPKEAARRPACPQAGHSQGPWGAPGDAARNGGSAAARRDRKIDSRQIPTPRAPISGHTHPPARDEEKKRKKKLKQAWCPQEKQHARSCPRSSPLSPGTTVAVARYDHFAGVPCHALTGATGQVQVRVRLKKGIPVTSLRYIEVRSKVNAFICI